MFTSFIQHQKLLQAWRSKIYPVTDCLIPFMDPTCRTQFSWPRNTLWIETPQGNTLIFRKIASLGFLDTYFFYFSSSFSGAHPPASCLSPPLAMPGLPWSLCSREWLFKKRAFRLESQGWSQIPVSEACALHSIAVWPRATYLTFLCYGLHFCKMGIMVSYRVFVKIIWVI